METSAYKLNMIDLARTLSVLYIYNVILLVFKTVGANV